MSMPIIGKIIGILFLICLSSCNDPDSYPRIKLLKQRSPIFIYVQIEGKKYIDYDKSYCLERYYQISKEYIGPLGSYKEYSNELDIKDFTKILPIEKCHKIVGYSTKKEDGDYLLFTNWLLDFRDWLLKF